MCCLRGQLLGADARGAAQAAAAEDRQTGPCAAGPRRRLEGLLRVHRLLLRGAGRAPRRGREVSAARALPGPAADQPAGLLLRTDPFALQGSFLRQMLLQFMDNVVADTMEENL